MSELNDYIMDSCINDAMCRANLVGEFCALKHNDEEEHQAVDYLCQGFGDKNNDGTYTVDYEVRIPVCSDCANGLYDNNWILFYCLQCNQSQWLSRRLARKEYPKDTHIVWFDEGCPHCVNVTKGEE